MFNILSIWASYFYVIHNDDRSSWVVEMSTIVNLILIMKCEADIVFCDYIIYSTGAVKDC